MKNECDITEEISIVTQYANLSAEERLRHYCDVFHERLVQLREVEFVNANQDPLKNPVSVDSVYPQCNELGFPQTIGCTHNNRAIDAILWVAAHLIKQNVPEPVRQELVLMREKAFTYKRNKLDIDRSMQTVSITVHHTHFGNEKMKNEEVQKHRAMVDDLFSMCDRLNQQINEYNMAL